MIPALNVVLVTVLWLGSALLALGVIQRQRDSILRFFALVVVLLAVQQTLAIDEYATSSLARLSGNLLGVAAAFCKVCFFRACIRQKGEPRPRLLREGLLVVLVAVVEIATFLLTPPSVRPAIGQPKNGYLLSAFVFEIVTTGYLASVSWRVIGWTRRLSHRVDNLPYRVSLILVGFASALSLAAGTLDVFTHVVAFAAPSRIGSVQPLYVCIYFPVAIGFVVFLVGAMLPVIIEALRAIPIAVLQFSEYRMMAPLWSALRAEFPHVRLHRQFGIHRRYYRRGIEIRDGLVLLRGYYDRRVAASAEEQSQARGEAPAVRSISVAVALVRAALVAHRARIVQKNPHPVPISGAEDWASDTAWIVALARAFSDVPTPPPARSRTTNVS